MSIGQNIKEGLVKLLGELVLITAGVYLGLVASNWNEQHNETIKQKDFLKNLSMEIDSNQQKLQQSLAYREHVLKTSQALYHTLGKDRLQAGFWKSGGFQLISGWKGIYIPPLENSVYQSGLISNTLHGLDFETIHAIAQVYNYQEEYKLWTRTLIFDKVTNIDNRINTAEALSLFQPWADIIGVEKSLMRRYSSAKTQLQKKIKE
ncbi:hypothetical protein [Xanthocytophaga flava]|uniref:hypothetical protein n=1 Tax=Xanthocytophaga flava TaxID=3048013 RepID=UPI0028D57239|nr:hypothetical protein [Xanthocytophaga flavus]MDJ1468027.1 hypothetical protein [Xanthocytophaga flavus]